MRTCNTICDASSRGCDWNFTPIQTWHSLPSLSLRATTVSAKAKNEVVSPRMSESRSMLRLNSRSSALACVSMALSGVDVIVMEGTKAKARADGESGCAAGVFSPILRSHFLDLRPPLLALEDALLHSTRTFRILPALLLDFRPAR